MVKCGVGNVTRQRKKSFDFMGQYDVVVSSRDSRWEGIYIVQRRPSEVGQ